MAHRWVERRWMQFNLILHGAWHHWFFFKNTGRWFVFVVVSLCFVRHLATSCKWNRLGLKNSSRIRFCASWWRYRWIIAFVSLSFCRFKLFFRIFNAWWLVPFNTLPVGICVQHLSNRWNIILRPFERRSRHCLATRTSFGTTFIHIVFILKFSWANRLDFSWTNVWLFTRTSVSVIQFLFL